MMSNLPRPNNLLSKLISITLCSAAALSLSACNSGSSSSGSSGYTAATANSLATINGESGLAITLQSSLSQIQPMGGSNSFCYTIGTNNVLYYYNAPCSPTVVQNNFIELNLIPFLSNSNDIPTSTASDANHNVYIQMLRSNSYGTYILKCNIQQSVCTTLTLPSEFWYSAYGYNFVNDAQGNLYLLRSNSYPWMSSDGGITWQAESFNLGTGYVQPYFRGLLFDPNTLQIVSQFSYINHFGNQSELVGLMEGSNNWNTLTEFANDNMFVMGGNIFSQTGYLYSIFGNYGDWDGGLGLSIYYYANGQDNMFIVNAPAGVNLNGATVYSSAFDQQNNLYITFSNGVTIYVKAPI